MSEMKTNVMRILEKENIHYRAYHYEHKDGRIDGASVAKKMGQDPRRVFKTLVTRGTDNQGKSYFVFVIPVEQELDLKRAAKAVGQKAVEMIHVNEINGVTGYIRGGCSPVGMKKPYPTVLDSSAQSLESIIVSAGKIGFQVELAPEDLIKLIGASYGEISYGEGSQKEV